MNSKFVRYTVEKYYIVKNKNRPVLSQLFNFLTTVVPIFRILAEHGYQTFLSRIDMKRKERRNRSCKKVYCIGLYISYGLRRVKNGEKKSKKIEIRNPVVGLIKTVPESMFAQHVLPSSLPTETRW